MAGDALKSPESQSELEKGLLIGPETLHEGSKAVEVDDNQDQPELCQLLNPELSPEQQVEKVKQLEGFITDIMAKLNEKGISLEVLKTKPQMLSKLVSAQELTLEGDEQIALSVFDTVIKGAGQVSSHFRNPELWEGMINEAGSLCRRGKKFFMNCYEEKPGLTLAVATSFIVGMGVLGYKLFASDKDKAVEANDNSKFWTKGKIAGVTLASIFAATYFGRDHLKEWLKDSVKDQEIKAIDKNKKDTTPFVPPESDERYKPSNTVLIGDSIAKGLAGNSKLNLNTDFIGEVGKSSSEVLENVRENRDKLKNKEVAVINVGGNDITKHPDRTPEQIAENIKAIIRECKKAGVKKIVLLTRFPYDTRIKEKWGSEFESRKAKSKALRDLLVEMDKKSLLEGVDLVDLYESFANENGELKKEYMHKKAILHPFDAYNDALGLIQSKVGKENFVRRVSAEKALT